MKWAYKIYKQPFYYSPPPPPPRDKCSWKIKDEKKTTQLKLSNHLPVIMNNKLTN